MLGKKEEEVEKVCHIGHIRVKRRYSTYFVEVDTAKNCETTIGNLRKAAAATMGIDEGDVRLCLEQKKDKAYIPLADNQLLVEAGVKNDTVVCAVLRNRDGEWEKPLVVPCPE